MHVIIDDIQVVNNRSLKPNVQLFAEHILALFFVQTSIFVFLTFVCINEHFLSIKEKFTII